jgi:hypothetical protein
MKLLRLLPLFALAGCTDPHFPINPSFGNSVTANMAAQIINPVPRAVYPDPTTNGKRMSDAMQRYRTERVYPPIPPIEAVVRQGLAPDQQLPPAPPPTPGPMQ